MDQFGDDRRGGRPARSVWRGRPAVALFTCAVVAVLVVAALLATGSATPAVAFAPAGHWIVNHEEGTASHVNPGTHQIDARLALPEAGRDAEFALQGDRHGFLVGRSTITTFGRSTLTVEETVPSAAPELPIGLEIPGGPYLVYRQAGTVVRLGVPSRSIPVGGPVGRPIGTDAGTVWVNRTDTGTLCSLDRDAADLVCEGRIPSGARGSLTVVAGRAAFLDAVSDAFVVLPDDGAAPVPVGTDLPEDVLVAARDTEGRLPVIDNGAHRLVLLDSAGVAVGRPGGPPIEIDLGPGRFSSPVAAGGLVAVVELTGHTLLIFRSDGTFVGRTALPPGGSARVTRGGDGRIYVDDADGAATHVVNPDGSVTRVGTGAGPATVTAPDAALALPVSLPSIPRAPRGGGGAGPIGVDPGPGPARSTGLAAPADVVATLGAGGAVAVSWSPVAGATGYRVRTVGGGTIGAPGTSATITGLHGGQSYTFVVTPLNNAGSGPESAPSNTVRIPVGPPAAPGGLTLTSDEPGPDPSARMGVRWTEPELNGGELIGYIVTATDKNGAIGRQDQVTRTQWGWLGGSWCVAPYTISVAAQTRDPGTGRTLTGPAATVRTTFARDCTVRVTLEWGGNGSTGFSIRTSTTGVGAINPECYLTANGLTKWSGRCGASLPETIYVGATPSTNYTVVMHIQQEDGTNTTSNTVIGGTKMAMGPPDAGPPTTTAGADPGN
ncbi:MAG: hypothetical protein L0H84_02935 [Pseudonocardia sp.]|nr:hypothetical protein [Pseudonocardia sp.]